MATINKDAEIKRLQSLNKRLYDYGFALLALGIASIVVNLLNTLLWS
jgi:hypothetical protein